MAKTDSLLVSSALQCGVSLSERTDWRGSYEKPDGTIVPAGVVRLGWTAEATMPAEIDAAERKLLPSMTPPEPDQVTLWIAELSVITARREDDPATESLRLSAYASRLRDYPADVVREALLVHRWRFFPSWAELGEVCDALVKPRRDMRAALERARAEAARRAADARALPEPGTVRQTPEERRKAAASVGDILAEMRRRIAEEEAAEPARDWTVPRFGPEIPAE